jgi:hypothetical protein
VRTVPFGVRKAAEQGEPCGQSYSPTFAGATEHLDRLVRRRLVSLCETRVSVTLVQSGLKTIVLPVRPLFPNES